MADAAIQAGLPGFVAIHACAHGNIRFTVELIAQCNLAMTILARGSFVQMRSMAEVDERRHFVNTHPWNGGSCFCELCQLPDFRAIGLYRRMTVHTASRGDDGHSVTRVGIGMAHFAREFQRSSMCLVIEGDGLLRCGISCAGVRGLRGGETGSHQES